MGESATSDKEPIPYQRALIKGAYFKLLWKNPIEQKTTIIIGKCIGVDNLKREYGFELVWTQSEYLMKLSENFPKNVVPKFSISFDNLLDFRNGDRKMFADLQILSRKEALTYEL